MPSVHLDAQEWQQVLNILGTTKEHPWVVTNPLLMKIGGQLSAPNLTGVTPQHVSPEGDGASKEVGHE